MPISFHRRVRLSGFSLIELIIFIGILAIALTSITLVYINTTRNSADPLIRIRSIELAKSTMEEILVKAYDENTPLGGGCVSYAAAGTSSTCVAGPKAPVASATLTAEEVGPASIRGTFDDVDDYNNLAYCGAGGVPDLSCTNPCIDMVNESGTSIKNEYAGYAICIKVSFAGGPRPATPPVKEINNVAGGVPVLLNDAKRIDVIVTDPLKSKISLTAYRLNY